MSAPSVPPSAPFQQWQNFYPGANPYFNSEPDQILAAMQSAALTANIYDSTTKVMGGINDTNRLLTNEITGISKDIAQTTLGLRDAIERGNMLNGTAIERVAGENRLTTITTDAASRQAANDSARDILRAVENNGASNMATTERVNSQLATAVERNGANGMNTTERIGGNIATAIERVAGEGRLTTTVTDAASRQAAADSARDITAAVERNGTSITGAVTHTHSSLLGAIERNAGENRMTTMTSAGVSDAKLTDVRHAILNDVNRGTNELLSTIRATNEAASTAIANGAWENRAAVANGFSSSMIEQLKAKDELALQSASQYANGLLELQKGNNLLSAQGSSHYASLLLEEQKMKEYLSSKSDNHFAINQLENQKIREHIVGKADAHYASLLLETQKIKGELASQASTHFSINQLEQQKLKECLSLQLADAKYEALKSQQYLADKMGECCCEVKEKIDTIDRDRLRDNLNVQKEETNLLKFIDFYGRGGYRRSRSRSPHRRHHH
jgi:hypothetical protein